MSMKEYPAKLTTGYYRVREDWEDEASQLGAYRLLANAKAKTKIKKLRTHSGNGSAWLTRQEKKIFPIFPFSMWKNRNFL